MVLPMTMFAGGAHIMTVVSVLVLSACAAYRSAPLPIAAGVRDLKMDIARLRLAPFVLIAMSAIYRLLSGTRSGEQPRNRLPTTTHSPNP
jgi:hypothetical protein